MTKKAQYRSGRGYPGGIGEAVSTWQDMRRTMSGSMEARWGGASTSFDWRHATNMNVVPLVKAPTRKGPKGRPNDPAAKPVYGPTTPGPVSNQSYGAESSILPSDQSKGGMGEDTFKESRILPSDHMPVGLGSDRVMASHSASLPMTSMGSALPWSPRSLPVAPAAAAWPSESSTLPAGGSYGGMTSDSPIYPSAGVASGIGSDSSIFPGSVAKSDIGGADSSRRRAGMNQVALNKIGVVRRNGGWPG